MPNRARATKRPRLRLPRSRRPETTPSRRESRSRNAPTRPAKATRPRPKTAEPRPMERPLTIGLTGGVAAGKSEALAAFARLGAATISSDAIVHELLDREPLLGRLAERWGDEIAAEGRVDRSRIGEIVFAEPSELAWLESQIHPLVGERIGGWLRSLPAATEVAVVEVPLLFETEMDSAFDTTVSVV